jgi:hypothetical protein
VVVGIALAVGALHFVTGPSYQGPFRPFVNGHLIDIVLPFAMFLVLGIPDHTTLRRPLLRAILVLGVGVTTETLQYFGAPIFGRTFDPLDYLMFGIGVGGGVVFERTVLSRLPEAQSR